MLNTNYNKAVGASVGVALGTLVAWAYSEFTGTLMPAEAQGAVTLILSAGLTALFPKNVGA